MNIIILDGYALNPRDLSWEGFEKLGTVTCYERTTDTESAIQRIGNAEIVITNKVSITNDILDRCPNICYIGVLATGYNIIDIQACCDREICVTNIPSYSTRAVSQAVFALLLDITNSVYEHNKSVQDGDWIRSPDFCYWTHPMTELAGKIFGILGFGDIGQKTALIACAMGMRVIAATRSCEKIDSFNTQYAALSGTETTAVVPVTKEELFAKSDIISLHCPLTDETKGIINASSISAMKKKAIIINTSRGPLVDEKAIHDALVSGKLGAYACDVVSSEPMKANNPLRGSPRCIITPHVAWAAKETRARLMDIAVHNLQAFLAGKPVNVVSK